MITIEQQNFEANKLRLLKVEYLKRLKVKEWQQNPLLWMKERLGEDPKAIVWTEWGEAYKDHQWDGDRNALARAWLDIAQKHWVGIEAGTGTGKTYILARIVFWFLDVYKDALVVTSAPKQDQLKLNLWAEIQKEFHKFKAIRQNSYMNFLTLRVEDGSGESTDQNLENSWQAIGFVAGSGVGEESATKARGFHRENMLIILEESSGMNPAVVAAFKNTCTGGNNVILAVGNPNSELDPLHQFCVSGAAKSYRISAFDFPNVVLGKEVVPGAVTLQSIERRKTEYGEGSPLYEAMVRGIAPTQSLHSLIKLAWINQCVDIELPSDGSYNAAGVDVANSLTGDKAAIAYGVENILVELLDFRCENASHLAHNLVFDDTQIESVFNGLVKQRAKLMGVHPDNLTMLPEEITRYAITPISDYGIDPENIGIDSVGVGASTLQQLHNLGYYATPLQGGQWDEAIPTDDNDRPLFAFASLRAQMYWIAREDLRQKNISIKLKDKNILKRLSKELVIPRYELKANTISVEAKESIKKRMGGQSPNLADAFVYWNFIRRGYRASSIALPLAGGRL